MSDRESAASFLRAELLFDGRAQSDRRDLVVLGRTILRSLIYIATAGFVSHEPRSSVRVRDRRTNDLVFEHEWVQEAQSAVQDFEAISQALRTMSLEEFLAEYGCTSWSGIKSG